MKRLPVLRLLLIFILTIAIFMTPAAALADSTQTYTVLVGAENVSRGVNVMANFPETLHVHVGDTVLWKQNTHEIHTVTFLGGTITTPPDLIVPVPPPPPALPGPLMINPLVAFPVAPAGGLYDGSSYANSGIMSTDPGQPTQFSLTFTEKGSFTYMCLVHGMMMSGTIVVEDSSSKIPSPAAVLKQAKKDINLRLARANELFGEAMSQVPPHQKNPDGTSTYTVLIGWSKGQYDLMQFFPGKLVVHPGDMVNFILSSANVAPHTVTFLNGAADIPFITAVPNPPGPPFLLLNPEILGPTNAGQPLTRTGIFNSGLLSPGGPGPTNYSLKIGDISGNIAYECLLHDTSGMDGLLKVVPR
jgi:plastocyanin